MCESTAYLARSGKEELFLKDVVKIKPLEGGKFLIENLLGEQRTLAGHIKEIDFMEHKILLGAD
jgi:predicted RNA-binding protein